MQASGTNTSRQERRKVSLWSMFHKDIELQVQNSAAIVADIAIAVESVVAAQRVLGDSMRYDALLEPCTSAAANQESPISNYCVEGNGATPVGDALAKTTSSTSYESMSSTYGKQQGVKRIGSRTVRREQCSIFSRLRWDEEVCLKATAAEAFTPLRTALDTRPGQAALDFVAQKRCAGAEKEAPHVSAEMLLLLDWHAGYKACLMQECVERYRLQAQANVDAAFLRQSVKGLHPTTPLLLSSSPSSPPPPRLPLLLGAGAATKTTPEEAQNEEKSAVAHKLGVLLDEGARSERLYIETKAVNGMLRCYRGFVQGLQELRGLEVKLRPNARTEPLSSAAVLELRQQQSTSESPVERDGSELLREKENRSSKQKTPLLLPCLTVLRVHPSRQEKLVAHPPPTPMPSSHAPRHLSGTALNKLSGSMKRQPGHEVAHASHKAAPPTLPSERASQRPTSSGTLRSMATMSATALHKQPLLPIFTVEEVPRRKRR